jgi:hypothetical protein
MRERTDGKAKSLEEVRDEVKREWMRVRRQELTEAVYQKLRSKYSIVVEQPQEREPLQSGSLSGGIQNQ